MNTPDEAKREKVRKFFRRGDNRKFSDRYAAEWLGIARSIVSEIRQELFPDPLRVGKVVRTGYERGVDGKTVRADKKRPSPVLDIDGTHC